MRSGLSNDCLSLEGIGDPFVRHNDAFLSHWQGLADAIQLNYSFNGKGSFSMKNIQLTTAVLVG